jgi:hypothetical protein
MTDDSLNLYIDGSHGSDSGMVIFKFNGIVKLVVLMTKLVYHKKIARGETRRLDHGSLYRLINYGFEASSRLLPLQF